MFRVPMRSLVRSLMALLVCATATPALAQVDVDDVFFIVTIAKSSEASDEITAEIRVQGTDLNTGTSTITFPNTSSLPQKTVTLQDDGSDLARGISFDDELELASVFPAGNYVLSIRNGTATATIVYDARPLVPSPDIELPDLITGVLPPGPLTVLFTECAVCNNAGDSVEALLEDDAMNELASETLTAADDEWVAPDGMGGELLLAENLDFLTRITHTTVRQKNPTITGNDDPTFLFTARFIQSDEVAFRTGFPPPTGNFCVVVNDPTPPAGCSPVDDPALFLLDTSGMTSTTVGGRAVDYTFTVGPKGDLTGTASADLGGDATKETVGAIKGKLKGKAGELKQKLSFPLVNEMLTAKLKVSVSDELSIPFDTRARVQKASGNLGVTKVKEETPTNGPLPFTPLGWRIDFTVDGSGVVQNGLLTLDGGRMFPLEGTDKFNLASNQSSLKLQTADKGIKLQLKKVQLDDEDVPTAVLGGDLSYKILGQSGKASLPPPPP